LGFNIHLEFRQYKFAEVCRDTFFYPFLFIPVFLAGLTNPGVVGEILDLFGVMLLSLDS
jgi:hypothetical protein